MYFMSLPNECYFVNDVIQTIASYHLHWLLRCKQKTSWFALAYKAKSFHGEKYHAFILWSNKTKQEATIYISKESLTHGKTFFCSGNSWQYKPHIIYTVKGTWPLAITYQNKKWSMPQNYHEAIPRKAVSILKEKPLIMTFINPFF